MDHLDYSAQYNTINKKILRSVVWLYFSIQIIFIWFFGIEKSFMFVFAFPVIGLIFLTGIKCPRCGELVGKKIEILNYFPMSSEIAIWGLLPAAGKCIKCGAILNKKKWDEFDHLKNLHGTKK